MIFPLICNKDAADSDRDQEGPLFTCTIPVEEFGEIVCAFYGDDFYASNFGVPDSFFKNATNFVWRNGRLSASMAIAAMTRGCEPALAIVIRNPTALVDAAFLERIVEAAQDCDRRFGAEEWAAAGSEGTTASGEIRSAIYCGDLPVFLAGVTPVPVIDFSPDLLIVNLRAFRAKKTALDASAAEIETYLPQLARRALLVSVFHPRLAFAAESKMAPRADSAAACGMEARADIDADAFAAIVSKAADAVSISIVVRTLFRRRYLLKRLLVSIARARPSDMSIEVVLASDAPDAQEAFLQILNEHRQIPLRLVKTPAGDEPSRNRNLRAGVEAAQNEYLWIIDDDDYVDIFAFDRIRRAFFGKGRPLIYATCDVHEEKWVERGEGEAALAQSRRVRDYPAASWREMFYGYNRIPVCGCLAPTDFVKRRLSGLRLDHDLSEDYALHLQMLSAPDLPEIFEVAEPVAHISQRLEGENTMQMADRSPWARNITSYLSDNSFRAPAPGGVQLLAALGANMRDRNSN